MAGVRKELKFYGQGFEQIIINGVKLGTMRPAGRYNFDFGEEVVAVCEGEGEVPIVAFATENRRIIDTPRPLLLLDGFMWPKEAAERMQDFYPGTGEETIMGLTTFISRDLYASYDDSTRKLLTTLPQEEAIKIPELRKVFFPSLAWWMAQNGGNCSDWSTFLEETGLVSDKELLGWCDRNGRAVDFLTRHQDQFARMVNERRGSVYRQIVLLLEA